MSLRKYLPKTLFLRSLMILVTPVVLIHLISGYVFFERHWDYVSHLLSHNIVGEINSLIHLSTKEHIPLQHLQTISLDNYGITCTLSQKFPVSEAPDGMSGRVLDESLKEKLQWPYAVHRTHNDLTIFVKTSTDIFQFSMSAKRLAHRTTLLFVLWALGSSILFLIIAGVVMHNQIRPLYRLAHWSDTLNDDPGAPLVSIEGAREIRKIAIGIRTVVQQIRRNFEERNQMLLGISHDLRTPLARIKLQLELMPQTQDTQELHLDVTQMIQMVNGYLVFARQEQEQEHMIPLAAFLTEFMAGFKEEKISSEIALDEKITVPLKPIQFRRCLQNLMDNARRYAKENIMLRAHYSARKGMCFITIEDDGDGIADELHEAIFNPFFRADTARHLDGESVGLGLSIVKTIVLNHNGRIRVDTSPLGGALFEISLPAKPVR